jgi:hypothetical protein
MLAVGLRGPGLRHSSEGGARRRRWRIEPRTAALRPAGTQPNYARKKPATPKRTLSLRIALRVVQNPKYPTVATSTFSAEHSAPATAGCHPCLANAAISVATPPLRLTWGEGISRRRRKDAIGPPSLAGVLFRTRDSTSQTPRTRFGGAMSGRSRHGHCEARGQACGVPQSSLACMVERGSGSASTLSAVCHCRTVPRLTSNLLIGCSNVRKVEPAVEH